MPYVVTEGRMRYTPVTEERYFNKTSVRAVVDLAQAQRLAHNHVLGCEVRRSKTEMDLRMDPFYDKALSLPGEGGMIGPLPDGTVITVAPISLLRLLADPQIREQCQLASSDEVLIAQAVRAYNKGR